MKLLVERENDALVVVRCYPDNTAEGRHIEHLEAYFDDMRVFTADLSGDVANPAFLMFRLKAGYAGMLEVRWLDAAGHNFTHQQRIDL